MKTLYQAIFIFLLYFLNAHGQQEPAINHTVSSSKTVQPGFEFQSSFEYEKGRSVDSEFDLEAYFSLSSKYKIILGTEMNSTNESSSFDLKEFNAGIQYRQKLLGQRLRLTFHYSHLASDRVISDKFRRSYAQVELESRTQFFDSLQFRSRIRHQNFHRTSDKNKVERASTRLQIRPLIKKNDFAFGFEYQISNLELKKKKLYSQDLSPTIQYQTKNFEFSLQSKYALTDRSESLIARNIRELDPSWIFEIETNWN